MKDLMQPTELFHNVSQRFKSSKRKYKAKKSSSKHDITEKRAISKADNGTLNELQSILSDDLRKGIMKTKMMVERDDTFAQPETIRQKDLSKLLGSTFDMNLLMKSQIKEATQHSIVSQVTQYIVVEDTTESHAVNSRLEPSRAEVETTNPLALSEETTISGQDPLMEANSSHRSNSSPAKTCIIKTKLDSPVTRSTGYKDLSKILGTDLKDIDLIVNPTTKSNKMRTKLENASNSSLDRFVKGFKSDSGKRFMNSSGYNSSCDSISGVSVEEKSSKSKVNKWKPFKRISRKDSTKSDYSESESMFRFGTKKPTQMVSCTSSALGSIAESDISPADISDWEVNTTFKNKDLLNLLGRPVLSEEPLEVVRAIGIIKKHKDSIKKVNKENQINPIKKIVDKARKHFKKSIIRTTELLESQAIEEEHEREAHEEDILIQSVDERWKHYLNSLNYNPQKLTLGDLKPWSSFFEKSSGVKIIDIIRNQNISYDLNLHFSLEDSLILPQEDYTLGVSIPFDDVCQLYQPHIKTSGYAGVDIDGILIYMVGEIAFKNRQFHSIPNHKLYPHLFGDSILETNSFNIMDQESSSSSNSSCEDVYTVANHPHLSHFTLNEVENDKQNGIHPLESCMMETCDLLEIDLLIEQFQKNRKNNRVKLLSQFSSNHHGEDSFRLSKARFLDSVQRNSFDQRSKVRLIPKEEQIGPKQLQKLNSVLNDAHIYSAKRQDSSMSGKTMKWMKSFVSVSHKKPASSNEGRRAVHLPPQPTEGERQLALLNSIITDETYKEIAHSKKDSKISRSRPSFTSQGTLSTATFQTQTILPSVIDYIFPGRTSYRRDICVTGFNAKEMTVFDNSD
ncbi:hypothetical protein BC833DRAFT_599651 [Globomyces pollinis-pini]|nr:hypothetical protein BC833DRAFT_599651 [Globomyces pollinis-pini]